MRTEYRGFRGRLTWSGRSSFPREKRCGWISGRNTTCSTLSRRWGRTEDCVVGSCAAEKDIEARDGGYGQFRAVGQSESLPNRVAAAGRGVLGREGCRRRRRDTREGTKQKTDCRSTVSAPVKGADAGATSRSFGE